jgi:spore maturation protein CgeB
METQAPRRRILFVGYLWDGSSCVPRMETLRALGHDVEAFDCTPVFTHPSRIVNAISHRYQCTPRVIRMNASLRARAAAGRHDLVWVEKGTWIFPSTLKALRRFCRFLVQYNTDDLFGPHSSFRLMRRGLRNYDLQVTTNRHNVTELRERYAVHAMRAGMGYVGRLNDQYRPPAHRTIQYDAAFIGHWEPHTEAYVTALRSLGWNVALHGAMWRKASDPMYHSVTELPFGAIGEVLSSARFGLCSLSRWNRNESTGRSFEITALGVAMLAERTSEHEFLFVDGKGCILFESVDELREKALEFRHSDDARLRIAEEGRTRNLGIGFTWEEHMRREWPIIERRLFFAQPFSYQDDDPFWSGFRNGILCSG